MQNRDFIITSLQPWDIEIGSTIKNTALEISKTNRVLYINTPMDYSTRLRGSKNKAWIRRMDVIKKQASSIRQINKQMWIADCPFCILPVGGLPTTRLFDWINKINNRKIANYIRQITVQLNFNNYIHLIDTDIYRSQYLKEYLNSSLSIYYCRDFVIGESYWKKNGARLEPLLAAKSDIVLANSTHFAERFRQYNCRTFSIETGVNLSLYDGRKKWLIPEDIKPIPHPIIGYVGTVNSTRLDSNLLLQIAKERPAYNFVFTGPEDEAFSKHPIHRLPNVYFLGKKQVEVLPAYINSYDVCINPQMVNDITNGNYPLKIDEYLAMGKPVVATSTHTMRDIFSMHTYLPINKDEYLQALDQALKETNDPIKKEERICFAETHSWGHSVQKIYNIIEQFQKEEL
ncbi:glycosyltransferase [uncultured Parabacteroides sp.]|uniref:glycosyltransferase n=1 Tax=uncultured Parabacteroides sp. TaxID=512312 RepID=UPI0026067848|nr:glycosyltransferase [uncultured Parabacteroides sp.]